MTNRYNVPIYFQLTNDRNVFYSDVINIDLHVINFASPNKLYIVKKIKNILEERENCYGNTIPEFNKKDSLEYKEIIKNFKYLQLTFSVTNLYTEYTDRMVVKRIISECGIVDNKIFIDKNILNDVIECPPLKHYIPGNRSLAFLMLVALDLQLEMEISK